MRLSSLLFFSVGANLSASWLQSSKVQTEKRRERWSEGGWRAMCVEEEEEGWRGGAGKDKIDGGGGGRSYGQQ